MADYKRGSIFDGVRYVGNPRNLRHPVETPWNGQV